MKTEKIYGLHALTSILKTAPWRIKQLFLAKGKQLEKLAELAKANGIKMQWCDKKHLDKLVNGSHQGAVALCQAQKALDETALTNLIQYEENPLLFLILDQVEDPHNLGACLRSADAFGVDAVIVPKHHACTLNETVKKVACGAAETLPFIEVTNLARTIKTMQEKNIWFYGLDMQAEKKVHEINYPKRCAFVLGAEGHGIRRLTAELCDELIKIPMQGSVESLNVSVAAGITLFAAMVNKT